MSNKLNSLWETQRLLVVSGIALSVMGLAAAALIDACTEGGYL
mgnify:CR=1